MVILDLMSNSLKPARHYFLLFFKNADLSASYNIVQYEKLGLLKSFVHKHLITQIKCVMQYSHAI